MRPPVAPDTFVFVSEVELAPNGLLALAGSADLGTGLWFYDPAGTLLQSRPCGHAANAGTGTVRFSGDSLRVVCVGRLTEADPAGYVFLDAPSL